MTVLVIGATGFLGTSVAVALENRGHQVVRFSRRAGGDLLDAERVRLAAAGCEAAILCAGKVSRKVDDAEELYRVHVEGTKCALDACASAGVRRVVIASTSGTVAVSERDDRIATEDDPVPIGIIARWPYYRAKLFAEQAALARSRPGFDVVSANPSWLLGPGDPSGSSTADVRAFLDGRMVVVPAGGLSFVDVRDAADAMCNALERGRAGERYLLGGCNLTFGEFLGRLSRVSGVASPIVRLPRSREIVRIGATWIDRIANRIGMPLALDPVAADMAQHFWYVDSSKAAHDLDFRPRDPSVTLGETVADLRARGVVWPRDEGASVLRPGGYGRV